MHSKHASHQTASRQPGAPLRVVDQWTSHLKFAGREPRTLEELAVARADYDHRRRLAEIGSMRKKLGLLAAFVPALANAGIRVADRDITTWDGGKSLRIQPPLLSRDNKLHAALLELGFRETERRTAAGDVDITLKHGRWLVVRITIRVEEGGVA